LERQLGRLLERHQRAAGRYVIEFVPDPTLRAGVRLDWRVQPEWDDWARWSEAIDCGRTTGMVLVAFLTARVAGVVVAIRMSGLSRMSYAAKSGKRVHDFHETDWAEGPWRLCRLSARGLSTACGESP
jgi:hypothetical protein